MSFDMLNDAVFAQMERLANATGEEEINREIARSEAVSKLAGNIIGNAKNAIDVMRLQATEGIDLAGQVATRPKMLGPSTARRASEEVGLPWIEQNARNHTAVYMADRLGWTHEEVVSACDKLGVAPKALVVGKVGLREAEADKLMRSVGGR